MPSALPAPGSDGLPVEKVEGRDGNRPAFPFVNGTIMRINVARRGPQSLSFALLNIKETKPKGSANLNNKNVHLRTND